MLLQTSLTSRRKFLERSAWGFGSAFLLPSLLQSCMQDHNIPPVNPPRPPLLTVTDADIDWNDDAKTAVVAGIGMIPEVGEILGPLVDILWPSTKEDVWGQIKAQVEALIDQKIAAQVYIDVSNDLTGLYNDTSNYQSELNGGAAATILAYWVSADQQFSNSLPHFQSDGNQLPLLPLFGQFATMHLALLRDGALFGKNWGMNDTDVQNLAKRLNVTINTYYGYAADTFNKGRLDLANKTKTDYHLGEKFRTINKYDRQMTFTVLDFMNSWPFFSASQFPNGTTVELTREIYTDPYGTGDDSGAIVIDPLLPKQFPTQLSVWGGDRIQAVQVTYPAGSGPGGVTQTKRMGAGGGNLSTLTLSPENPINWLQVQYGSIVNGFQFFYADGSYSPQFGLGYVDPKNKPTETGWFTYANESLSSIHINGASNFYNSADLVVFGFQYRQLPTETLKAIRAIYVKSPKERSVADFTKAFPKVSIPANLINNELKAARQAYWAALKARVK